MKKLIAIISSVVIFFIAILGIILYFILNNASFMNNFNFINVSNIGTSFYVYFQKVKTAKNYDVLVYDSNEEIVYKDNITDNNIEIYFDELKYNEVYKIIVIANDKNNIKKSVEKPYIFVWEDISFSRDNIVLMDNNSDYIIKFLGNYKNKEYILSVKYENQEILTERINDNEYIIKNKIFKDKKGEYLLEILDNNMVISSFKVYNLTSPITDISIINPSNGDMQDYDDVFLSFVGGDNASNYFIELYQENKLIRRKEISNNKIILSNNLFDKASTYTVKIIASYFDYIDYSKSAKVDFSINAKETLKPVYTNYNFNLIKYGSKIKLLSEDENASIYYTLDGSDPSVNGILYTEEIDILSDITIKAIAKSENKNDSIISTFDFKIGVKPQYKVYLSPSNQTANLGVSEVGYTNEEKEMNDLTDYIERKLKSYNVIVYRNGFGGINRWVQDSVYLGVDLHLAIHSNASEDHKSYGIETWIDDASSKTYSLAQNIQKDLMNIYYNKNDELSDRGVKYAHGSLGEVNSNYLPFGILLEVAHHDYKDDAEWIMNNKELIGNTIADSILEYFQIK